MRRRPPSPWRPAGNHLPAIAGCLAAVAAVVLGGCLFADRFDGDGVGVAALAVGAVASFGWLVLAGVRAEERERRALANRCRTCGYSLTGNVSGVCPECGSRAARRDGRADGPADDPPR